MTRWSNQTPKPSGQGVSRASGVTAEGATGAGVAGGVEAAGMEGGGTEEAAEEGFRSKPAF